MLVLLNEHMFVVYVFDDKVVSVLLVDPADDGFDGRIALDEYSFAKYQSISHKSLATTHPVLREASPISNGRCGVVSSAFVDVS